MLKPDRYAIVQTGKNVKTPLFFMFVVVRSEIQNKSFAALQTL